MDAAREIPTEQRSDDVVVVDMGRIKFEHAWELQRHAHHDLIAGKGRETIFLGEHEPVITLGTSGSTANILVPDHELTKRGISLFAIERGGDVTYHGPGQLVVYPILDLNTRKRDVHWYMRTLEAVILNTLEAFGIHGHQIEGKTGVWTSRERDGKKTEPRKIASIGVRMSRWTTLHGFSLNVRRCDEGFALIHPCGMPGVKVTSLEEECSAERNAPMAHLMDDAKREVLKHLDALLIKFKVSKGVVE